uniref:Uncharacterized protein n=1 Tax=Glossina austeni TaxID=7395 RepID=A0A1A9VGR2_GLOAU
MITICDGSNKTGERIVFIEVKIKPNLCLMLFEWLLTLYLSVFIIIIVVVIVIANIIEVHVYAFYPFSLDFLQIKLKKNELSLSSNINNNEGLTITDEEKSSLAVTLNGLVSRKNDRIWYSENSQELVVSQFGVGVRQQAPSKRSSPKTRLKQRCIGLEEK